ncbi:protein kinase [Aliikangiella marina]|uniref:Protein kinase n=1 Tax=Aliikangiella marina TaxID=1712262 RepID=A0A545T763_9GAMM|nr:serine/threonine-protein kinase [Aliikangiella marina]TQV73057.1 protein kinase [Aliikangiella marina]
MSDLPNQRNTVYEGEFPRREAPPKTLGRYRILNEVGRGATAFVYKAYDPQLDRFLAIKVLREELARDKDYRDAFLKEARLAAALTHPGIVTIFDVGVADNKPYIGMELLEGATLEQILSTQGKINLKTVLAMAIQLSRALSYAHKQGVVHRDIKPGNIVVLKDKKTVKLTDFGIAQLDETLGKAGKRSDKVLGTPEYMAPEQVLGQPVDSRSDLYSFGVLIFRMLMGMAPFVNDDLGELFKQIIKSKPPQLIVQEEVVKDDLQDLVRKLLQKQPHKRFDNAAKLTADLRGIQNKLGNKKLTPKKQFVSLRLRWTAMMAGIVFVSMCIGLATVYYMQYRALSGITFDYGRSIARMLAYESSEPILLDDTIGLNALVSETSNNEQLKAVFVMDNNDLILASTEIDSVNQTFQAPEERELMQSQDNIIIYKRIIAEDEVLFDIATPILFGDKNLGRLYVSFSADSMYAASKTTLVTMLMVMMITLIIVFAVTLELARRTSKDFQRITQALNKMSMGRVDARLISERNDEVGQLFAAFNQLAKFLENRFDSPQKNSASQVSQVTVTKVNETLHDEELEETVELDIVTQQKK